MTPDVNALNLSFFSAATRSRRRNVTVQTFYGPRGWGLLLCVDGARTDKLISSADFGTLEFAILR